jgi:hypothetical protein
MVVLKGWCHDGEGNLVVGRRNFGRNENRASRAEKFDTDWLSLHVFSIPLTFPPPDS